MTRDTWSTPAFEAIAAFVRERTGLMFPPNRQMAAEAGVRRAMGRIGVSDAAVYLDLIERAGAPLDDLLAELTIGETYFFREPAQFNVLRDEILPELMAKRPPGVGLRAWSAACASGEEAYSLAILLNEQAPNASHLVLGTDLSRPRLLRARRGAYRRWSLRGVPESVVQQYFRVDDETFELVSSVRAAAEFRFLNLAEDQYPAISTGVWGMDIIFCRNVLIYFDRQTIARVAERLLCSLNERGWLFLGASDPVLSDVVKCDVVQTAAGLAYRRQGAERTHLAAATRRMSARGGTNDALRPFDQAMPLAPRIARLNPQPTPEAPPPVPASVPRSDIDAGTPSFDVTPSVGSPVEPSVQAASRTGRHDDLLTATFATRDFARVVTLAQQAQRDGDDSAQTDVLLVRSLANLGRLDEAGRVCATALDRHRMSAELLYLHAVLLVQANRPGEGAAAARRALYLDRSMAVAHLTLASAFARLGDRQRAILSFGNAEKLLAKMPPESIVSASDGETAGRLLAMARTQRVLLTKAA